MAQSKLALKIKVDIRDQFEAPTCTVQKTFKTLEGLVGLQVSCNPEWEMLWAELASIFPDKATFVPNVAGVVVMWCNILATRLEDDKLASWTETLIGKLANAGVIGLRILVSEISRPETAFYSNDKYFVLTLPRNAGFSPATSSAGLETAFQNLFTVKPEVSSAQNLSSKDDDWDAIDPAGEAHSVKWKEPDLEPDVLPAVETLASPDILLRTLTPYILIVTLRGSNKIVINGTHEPSLQLLSEYLQRWIKRDHNDTRKVPLLRISLSESHFGLGLSHDTLIIEPYDHGQRHVEVNPVIIHAFIEGVLAYQRLPSVSPGLWEYRRVKGFK